MPETAYTNGYSNGHGTHKYEMEDGQTFLFTSESVGEGHPGEHIIFHPFFNVIAKFPYL